MSAPRTTDVETSLRLEEGGTLLYAFGKVTLGGRWPVVTQLRVVDSRTENRVQLSEPDAEFVESALVEEAQAIWRTP